MQQVNVLDFQNKQMRNLLIIMGFCLLFACETPDNSTEVNIPTDSITFDSALASEYGADEYGMKKYVIAFLKKGPNRDLDSAKAVELQRAHLDNIGRMAEEGTLVLAGPFFGNDDLRGIYIFNVSSIAEAEELTKTDPAIQEGSLVMELKEWYGSAALMAVNEIHPKMSKTPI